MAHVSPSGDIETPETMSIETSQAILIQQLKRQLEEVRKETMERGQLNKPHEVSEQRKVFFFLFLSTSSLIFY